MMIIIMMIVDEISLCKVLPYLKLPSFVFIRPHMNNATPFLVMIGGNFLAIVVMAYVMVGGNNIVIVLASMDVGTFTAENGVMIRDYGGVIGKVYNPLAVATGGLNYYDEYKENGDKQSREYFLNTANWLVNHSIDKGQYTLWEYDFPWQNERIGWIASPWYLR